MRSRVCVAAVTPGRMPTIEKGRFGKSSSASILFSASGFFAMWKGPFATGSTAKGLPSPSRCTAASPALRDPVRARELPEQIIEAAVLHVEHEDVGQPVEPAGRLSEHRRCQRRPDKSRAASEPHPKPHRRPPLFVRL